MSMWRPPARLQVQLGSPRQRRRFNGFSRSEVAFSRREGPTVPAMYRMLKSSRAMHRAELSLDAYRAEKARVSVHVFDELAPR